MKQLKLIPLTHQCPGEQNLREMLTWYVHKKHVGKPQDCPPKFSIDVIAITQCHFDFADYHPIGMATVITATKIFISKHAIVSWKLYHFDCQRS